MNVTDEKKFKKNVSDVTFFSNTVLLHIGRSLVTHAFFVKQLSSVAICYLLLGFGNSSSSLDILKK